MQLASSVKNLSLSWQAVYSSPPLHTFLVVVGGGGVFPTPIRFPLTEKVGDFLILFLGVWVWGRGMKGFGCAVACVAPENPTVESVLISYVQQP